MKCSINAVWLHNGDKQYILAIFNDVSNLSKYIKSAGIFNAIIDNSDDGVIVAESRDNAKWPIITYANPALEKITGYDHKKILCKELYNLFELNVDSKILDELYRNINNNESTELEYKYIKKNGEICWIDMRVIPIRGSFIKNDIINATNLNCVLSDFDKMETYSEIYFLFHQKDITKFKKIEKDSEIYINELEKEVAKKSQFVSQVLNGLSVLLKENDKNTALNSALEDSWSSIRCC